MNAAIPERRPATEEISGVIERVTFHSDESGFCVLRVKARGQREETTVVGSLPSVTAGEWLVAEGWWVRNREDGLEELVAPAGSDHLAQVQRTMSTFLGVQRSGRGVAYTDSLQRCRHSLLPPTKHSCPLPFGVYLSGFEVIGNVLVAFPRRIAKHADAIVVVLPNKGASGVE
jgi:hypothetical protein